MPADHFVGGGRLWSSARGLHVPVPWAAPWRGPSQPWSRVCVFFCVRFVYAETLKPDLGGLFWSRPEHRFL